MSISNDIQHIADVVQVLNSGIDFYSQAREKVDDANVQYVFDQMIEARKQARARLQPLAMLEKGEVEDGSDWAVETRRLYAKVIAAFSDDEVHTLVDQLEEVEDKTLKELKTAFEKSEAATTKRAVAEVLTLMQACHDKMLALQKSTA